MALQHKIKWEIALSCRKKKSENNLEFPFKSRTDAAARRCRRVRSKNNKSHSKVKASFDGSKELKNSIFFSSSICSIISHGPFTAKFSQADSSFSLLFKVLLRISKWDLSDKSMCGCLHRGFLICFDSSRSKKSLFTCLFGGYLCLTLEISLGLFSPIVEGK